MSWQTRNQSLRERNLKQKKRAQARVVSASERRQGTLLGVVITILMALALFMWAQQARAAVGDPDITEAQVDRLKKDYGVYMVGSSRINVAGITPANVEYLAESIAAVL